MGGLPAALRPAGLAEADAAAHVLVDGARRQRTVLLLSHWPGGDVADALRRDTSTESALAYLHDPLPLPRRAGLVALDHLDEDGLASLFALARPLAALDHEATLVDLARAGDFDDLGPAPGAGTGARAAWALRAVLDPRRSPLAALRAPSPGPALTAGLLGELVEVLADILARPGDFEHLWIDEAAAYEHGLAALAGGLVHVEERPELGLAVVTCDERLSAGPATVGARTHEGRLLPVHPAALHAATEAARILVVHGRRYTYYDRYETWVAYTSRPLPPRRDLTPLATSLAAAEGEAGAWTAAPPSAPGPVLASRPGWESRLEPSSVVAALVAHLVAAPPAWFPRRGDPSGARGAPEAGSGDARPRRSAGPRAGTSGRARARWRGRRRGRPSA